MPRSRPAGNWLVAFHGYVGNWDELSSEHALDLRDAVTTAERIAVGYEAWGDALFARLRGEFAILVWSRRERRLLAVRDAVGCRPLHFEQAGGRTFVASEARQVLAGSGRRPELNEDVMVDSLVRRHRLTEETFFVDVSRMMPAVLYRFRGGRAGELVRGPEFWTPPPMRDATEADVPDLVEELAGLLRAAVRRAIPAAPFAVSVSGGMDSTTVWALVRELRTHGSGSAGIDARPFSLVFPGFDCDERPFIEACLGEEAGRAAFIDGAAQHGLEVLTGLWDSLDVVPFETTYLVCAGRSRRGGGRSPDRPDRPGRGSLASRRGPTGTTGSPRHRHRTWRWWTVEVVRCEQDDGSAKDADEEALEVVWPRSRCPLVVAPLPLGRLDAGGGDLSGRDPTPDSRQREVRSMLTVLRREFNAALWESIDAHYCIESRQPLMDLDLVAFAFTTPGTLMALGGRSKGLLRLAASGWSPHEVVARPYKTLFEAVCERDHPALSRASASEAVAPGRQGSGRETQA